jgi:hypothetical protein
MPVCMPGSRRVAVSRESGVQSSESEPDVLTLNSRLRTPDYIPDSELLTQIWLFQKHLYICKVLNQSIYSLLKTKTVAYENNDKKMESIYSKRIRAGKRRTYFFDVRTTRGNDYYLTITESRKRFDDNGYDRHKVFLYKEDFNKFIKALTEAVDYVKTDLMPDFDFDAFNHDEVVVENENGETESTSAAAESITPEAPAEEVSSPASVENTSSTEEADKW